MLSLIGLAVAMFVATNLDDAFVLLAFLADPRFRTRQVAAGQYLGMAALFGLSLAVSLISLALSAQQIGFLGALPVLIGVKKLIDLVPRDRETEADRRHGGVGPVLAVAGVTVANGGDNLGVYAPVFATRTPGEIMGIAVVFTIQTAVWVFAAHTLVRHPQAGAPIRRYGPIASPIVLIGLGILVLHEGGSLTMLNEGLSWLRH